jgi:hypothetical protein
MQLVEGEAELVTAEFTRVEQRDALVRKSSAGTPQFDELKISKKPMSCLS